MNNKLKGKEIVSHALTTVVAYVIIWITESRSLQYKELYNISDFPMGLSIVVGASLTLTKGVSGTLNN